MSTLPSWHGPATPREPGSARLVLNNHGALLAVACNATVRILPGPRPGFPQGLPMLADALVARVGDYLQDPQTLAPIGEVVL